VAYLLLAPGSDTPSPEWLVRFAELGGDKLVHGVLFFVQAAAVAWTMRGAGPSRHWTAAVTAALYGLVLEFGQLGVEGRGWDVADVVANAAGAGLWAVLQAFRAR